MPNATLSRIIALGATLLACLAGCATYVNYPSIGEDPAVNDPNIQPTPTVIGAALHRVVSLYPVRGEYVVNYPEGMARRLAERINSEVDDNARLHTPDTQDLPVYHIKRVWVRGDSATVEVLRPVTELPREAGSPEEDELYQSVVVRLRQRPLEPWRIEYVRAWTIGAAEPPPMNGWPEDWEGEAAPESGGG